MRKTVPPQDVDEEWKEKGCMALFEQDRTWKEFCKHSPTIEEERLHRAICRGLNRAIEDKGEIMEMLLANLSYGVTGEDGAMEVYALEQQIKTLEKGAGGYHNTQSGKRRKRKRFMEMVTKISKQLCCAARAAQTYAGQTALNENHKYELERVKDILMRQEIGFHEYDDTTVRLLVEYIKVMPEGKIVIVLKGGGELEEAF